MPAVAAKHRISQARRAISLTLPGLQRRVREGALRATYVRLRATYARGRDAAHDQLGSSE